ncbi:MAG: hypothetical protein ABSD85_16860 [Acidimicrobiales bacterium]
MQPRPDGAGRYLELARDLVDGETHHGVENHGLSGSHGQPLQGLDDVEVIRVRSLTLFGEDKLMVSLFEQLAAPAIGRKVPHNPPAPGFRVVVAGDAGPVLPDADKYLLSEILRILTIAGKKERLAHQAMGIRVKEEFELLTPLLIVHLAPTTRPYLIRHLTRASRCMLIEIE